MKSNNDFSIKLSINISFDVVVDSGETVRLHILCMLVSFHYRHRRIYNENKLYFPYFAVRVWNENGERKII